MAERSKIKISGNVITIENNISLDSGDSNKASDNLNNSTKELKITVDKLTTIENNISLDSGDSNKASDNLNNSTKELKITVDKLTTSTDLLNSIKDPFARDLLYEQRPWKWFSPETSTFIKSALPFGVGVATSLATQNPYLGMGAAGLVSGIEVGDQAAQQFDEMIAKRKDAYFQSYNEALAIYSNKSAEELKMLGASHETEMGILQKRIQDAEIKLKNEREDLFLLAQNPNHYVAEPKFLEKDREQYLRLSGAWEAIQKLGSTSQAPMPQVPLVQQLQAGDTVTAPGKIAEASSSYENLAKAIKQETVPALESLQEVQAANNLGMEAQQDGVEQLTDSYYSQTEALQLVTEYIRGKMQAEKAAAESKISTAQILKEAYDKTQEQLDQLGGKTLVGLSDAFAAAIVKGESFGDALKKMGDDIMYLVVKAMALKWLEDWAKKMSSGGGIGGIFGAIFSVLFNAHGNVFDPYGLQRFARGGIVSQPSLFAFAHGIGLMGEAGPEAIMPLGRDGRGNLGVRIADSAMYGASAASGVFAPHIEINIENSGGGDMTDEQARTLGTQINAAVEMQVAKQMYDYARSGIFRSGAGRGY